MNVFLFLRARTGFRLYFAFFCDGAGFYHHSTSLWKPRIFNMNLVDYDYYGDKQSELRWGFGLVWATLIKAATRPK